jgi:hypothetical protein
MDGEHKDSVTTPGTIKFIFDRHNNSLENWATTTKVFIILHRALQNAKVNRKVIKELKTKESLFNPYKPAAKLA